MIDKDHFKLPPSFAQIGSYFKPSNLGTVAILLFYDTFLNGDKIKRRKT